MLYGTGVAMQRFGEALCRACVALQRTGGALKRTSGALDRNGVTTSVALLRAGVAL